MSQWQWSSEPVQRANQQSRNTGSGFNPWRLFQTRRKVLALGIVHTWAICTAFLSAVNRPRSKHQCNRTCSHVGEFRAERNKRKYRRLTCVKVARFPPSCHLKDSGKPCGIRGTNDTSTTMRNPCFYCADFALSRCELKRLLINIDQISWTTKSAGSQAYKKLIEHTQCSQEKKNLIYSQ